MKIDRHTMNFLWAIFFVVVVFFVLVAGNKLLSQREQPVETVKYNQFTFQKIGGLWYTQWSRNGTLYTIPFHFNPYQVENVSSYGALDEEKFNSQPEVYITFDPEEGKMSYTALAAAELSLVMAQAIDVTPVAACARNVTDACYNRTIADCDSEDKAVIYLRNANATAIILNDNCITISGPDAELLRSTDNLLYVWLGIFS